MANAAIYLDRDGTLIHDPGYLNHPDQVQVIEGVAEALQEFHRLGYKTVVASNQSGVARGLVTVEMLERIHDRLRELLAAKGASLDAIYYCPYHPDGVVPEYRQDSDWQKPKPGMLLAAAQEMDLDLTRSWMIGDNDRDVEAGRRAGCKTILIGAPHREAAPSEQSKPDYVAVNMREAVNIIKRYQRSSQERRMAPAPEPGHEQSGPPRSVENMLTPREPLPGGPEGGAATGSAPPPSRGPEVRDTIPATAPGPAPARTETDQLLASILEQLRRMHKREAFGEFSLIRLLAGVVQVFVPFCLLLALWFLMGSRRQDSNVLLALGFAAVLQLMALAFYLMRGKC